jgi:hypothetical protein
MTAGSENVYMLVVVDPAIYDALKCETEAQKLSDRRILCSLTLPNVS